MKKNTTPIPFAGSQLDETRHVCAFFNSDDEEFRVLLPFIRDWFQCGHKGVWLTWISVRNICAVRLPQESMRLPEQSGQRELRVNTDVYVPDGRFCP